jgi:hypothetical protein
MTIEHLDNQKAFALIGEMTSTRNLLGYGVKVLRGARFIETTRDYDDAFDWGGEVAQADRWGDLA